MRKKNVSVAMDSTITSQRKVRFCESNNIFIGEHRRSLSQAVLPLRGSYEDELRNDEMVDGRGLQTALLMHDFQMLNRRTKEQYNDEVALKTVSHK